MQKLSKYSSVQSVRFVVYWMAVLRHEICYMSLSLQKISCCDEISHYGALFQTFSASNDDSTQEKKVSEIFKVSAAAVTVQLVL